MTSDVSALRRETIFKLQNKFEISPQVIMIFNFLVMWFPSICGDVNTIHISNR